jgi:hypothetical protein
MMYCNNCHNQIVDDNLTSCPICEKSLIDKGGKPTSWDPCEDATIPMSAYMTAKVPPETEYKLKDELVKVDSKIPSKSAVKHWTKEQKDKAKRRRERKALKATTK